MTVFGSVTNIRLPKGRKLRGTRKKLKLDFRGVANIVKRRLQLMFPEKDSWHCINECHSLPSIELNLNLFKNEI